MTTMKFWHASLLLPLTTQVSLAASSAGQGSVWVSLSSEANSL